MVNYSLFKRCDVLRVIVLSILLCITSLGNLACTMTGALREDFYQPDSQHEHKLPLRVVLIPDRTLASQRFVATYGATNGIDIALDPGVMNAVKKELATIFELVNSVSGKVDPGQSDAIAFVRFSLAGGGSDYWTGRTEYDARMEVLLKDAQSKSMISRFERSSRLVYTPPSTPVAMALSIFPPLILWPVTLPWISYSMEEHAEQILERDIGGLVQTIADDIRQDKTLLAFSRAGVGQDRVKYAEAPAALAPARSLSTFSDVDALPTLRSSLRKNAHAIVIGLEKYRGQLPKADFAESDAKLMAKYLTKVMGYAEENVAILTNDQATKSDLEKYIESWLPNRVEKDDTVLVYFSGHGAPNPKTGESYLVPYDGDPTFIDKTGYPLSRLYQHLADLPAKEVVVVLDSCFSGAGGRSVIAQGMRPIVTELKSPLLAKGKTIVLSASTGQQVSSTYGAKFHGLLTYFFLKGLQGEGDTNKDGFIELKELFDYLSPQVARVARREFNNEQTPQLLGSSELLTRGIRLVK